MIKALQHLAAALWLPVVIIIFFSLVVYFPKIIFGAISLIVLGVSGLIFVFMVIRESYEIAMHNRWFGLRRRKNETS